MIDGINPCAFGVLIFLLAYLTETAHTTGKVFREGVCYILGVFLTYLAAGLLLLPVLQQLGKFSVWSYYILAGIIILFGLLEIKDFFWYGKGFSLTIIPGEVERIKLYIKKVSDRNMTAFALGAFVALVELPCTGAVYVAVLTLMTLAGVNATNIWYLVLYNFIFVLPLFVILFFFHKGIETHRFEEFRQKHKGLMRLFIGLLLILLGIWMILSINVRF